MWQFGILFVTLQTIKQYEYLQRMKIALIGYGKMGHIIEQQAMLRGHEIVAKIDRDNPQDFHSQAFRTADVAIEFTTPDTAVANIRQAWEAGVPVVCGTTAWTERNAPDGHTMLQVLQQEARNNGKALFWTSNYSVGVNLFFALNRRLAQLMQPYPQYEVSMQETHHIHKKDAPSGTAITLAKDIETVLFPATPAHTVPVESIRQGEVPGTHTVTYESPVDRIIIIHEAKSREGFALGAVMAAEYLQGKTGFYDMTDMLSF